MTAAEMLDWLRAAGAEVSAVGDRLKVSAAPGALTPEVRETIARHKQELLDLLRATGSARGAEAEPPLVPIPRGGKLPVSLFQHRSWVLQQLQGDNESAFNMVTLWDMPGRDLPLLQRAIADVVRRHEILRCAIPSEGLEPYAVVLPPESVTIEVCDLQGLPPEQQRPRIEAEAVRAISEPFDLSVEPPARWRIYITEGGRLTTRLCADHIAVDEWSFVLLRKELDVSLAACAAGTLLPPPALQYADFAAWEKLRQNSPAVAADLAWWERSLAGLPRFCTFPPDHPGNEPVSQSYGFVIDPALTEELGELARSAKATLFMVLLAALATVLRRHTGKDDVAIGSSFGSRERPELESMIGAFVTVTVLRLSVGDDPTFAELLTRARNFVVDAYDHRQVSFEMLVERLKPSERSLLFAPWSQISLVMHNASDEEPSQIYSAGIVQNMTWFARKTDAGLVIFLEYRADLYERSTVERLASHFLAVLRDAVRDPSRRIDALSLLSPAERVAVTETFNATGADLDAAPVTLQFERQAARTPNAIAVRAPGTRATYAALNRRANQLARHLRDQGVGPGMLVGICLDRSVDLVASLLGVLKTGAAYVPLDPGFPAARLDYMAEHSGLALVVVDSGSQTGRGWAVRRVDLGADAAAIEARDGHDLGLVPGAGDPAYVIYTSGSTGRPNGVVVPHGALSNFLGAMLRAPGIGPHDVLAAVTTVSFDIAGLELYVPLIAGACVVLVPRAVATDGPSLANLLAEEQITIMQATPATWRLLLESGWRAPAGFVALCGGEALPEDLARSLHARVDALWNMYGPTETTIWSTAGRIETESGPVTIGRPIANTRVYVVDGSGRPVPIGVAGEIWIGGAGVASGYRGNPELTAEKFVADPFVGGAARLYRTGDLGRWLPDGRLAHMGRLDQQVKLRGFRIEPGEIEAALAAHESVREAVVLLRGEDPDVQRLVAYVLYRPGHDLTTSEARRHLQASLPDYMIPSLFVAVDAIPRTPNGKVDRRALPDPVGAGGSAAGYVEPATAAERLIARVWADTLKIERVGAEDNFFDLGGHSLLALRVAAAVEAETGWRMAPFVLFGQTLSQVAASLQAREAGTVVAT